MKEGARERKSSKNKNAREQRTERGSERERDIQRNWEQEPERASERGTECADAVFLVWTPQINNQQRFSRAVPGTGAYCQAPARPGPPCSQRYPHPSPMPPPFNPQLTALLWGRIGGAACLPVWAGPGLAHCHRAFACSGVLIKSFIVLHSRKELRRNTEQDGAEGRRESERGEKKREKKREGGEGREMGSLFFPSCFLLFSFSRTEKMFDLVYGEL